MYKFYFVLISLLWFQHDSVQRSYSVELSQNDILNALKIHNKARIEVGVNEIEWSDDLSDQAQEWANNLAKKDKTRDIDIFRIWMIVLFSIILVITGVAFHQTNN